MDNPLTSNPDAEELPELLKELRECANTVNKEFAKKLDVNESAAITCVKPSGTVSQLVDSGSGIHARHNEYYIRSVRIDIKDPLCQFMTDYGFPHEPDIMSPNNTMVFYFPIQSPGDSMFRKDIGAIDQLKMWLVYQTHWTEHKPSVTITVKENEWLEVAAFVYKHFNEISGVSFLPYVDHIYKQAPYQDCTKDEYDELVERMPKSVNWELLSKYETQDLTAGAQELACSGNSCEIVDLVK
jgi:ribonucleoside-diphosphate reductase alpha chain